MLKDGISCLGRGKIRLFRIFLEFCWKWVQNFSTSTLAKSVLFLAKAGVTKGNQWKQKCNAAKSSTIL